MNRILKQVIIVRKDLNMRKGKMCAQAAHASLNAALKAQESIFKKWMNEDQTKIVVSVDSEKELMDLYLSIPTTFPTYLVKDAGYTEFKEPTFTAVAIGPYYSEQIDEYTGNLKLL